MTVNQNTDTRQGQDCPRHSTKSPREEKIPCPDLDDFLPGQEREFRCNHISISFCGSRELGGSRESTAYFVGSVPNIGGAPTRRGAPVHATVRQQFLKEITSPPLPDFSLRRYTSRDATRIPIPNFSLRPRSLPLEYVEAFSGEFGMKGPSHPPDSHIQAARESNNDDDDKLGMSLNFPFLTLESEVDEARCPDEGAARRDRGLSSRNETSQIKARPSADVSLDVLIPPRHLRLERDAYFIPKSRKEKAMDCDVEPRPPMVRTTVSLRPRMVDFFPGERTPSDLSVDTTIVGDISRPTITTNNITTRRRCKSAPTVPSMNSMLTHFPPKSEEFQKILEKREARGNIPGEFESHRMEEQEQVHPVVRTPDGMSTDTPPRLVLRKAKSENDCMKPPLPSVDPFRSRIKDEKFSPGGKYSECEDEDNDNEECGVVGNSSWDAAQGSSARNVLPSSFSNAKFHTPCDRIIPSSFHSLNSSNVLRMGRPPPPPPFPIDIGIGAVAGWRPTTSIPDQQQSSPP